MKLPFQIFIILSLTSKVIFSQPSINGFFEYDNITYFNTIDDKVNGRNQAILQLELSHNVSSFANVFGSLEIRNDQADASRNRVYLDEAYLNLYLGNFDIRLGKQIFAWGRADGFNPTDNLSAWDYTDILDTEDEKVGTISGKVIYYWDDITLEGVLIPSFNNSILPSQNSRWFPNLSSKITNPYYPYSGNKLLSANYTLGNAVEPKYSFKNFQYALKFSGTYSGWDFSISWFDGFDDLPYLYTNTSIDSTFTNADITIKQNYYKRKSIGADFSTIINNIGFRGEVAYYITSDWDGNNPAIDNPYLQYALGIDYTFNDIINDDNLFVILQWIQELQIPDNNAVYTITDLNHIFQKSFMAKIDYNFTLFSKVYLQGVYNLDSEDWWFQPGIDWSVMEGVNLTVLFDILGGNENTFFGTFADNDRVQFKVKYNF